MYIRHRSHAPRQGSKNDFGPEAIEELMSVMTTGDPVMIFAGRPIVDGLIVAAGFVLSGWKCEKFG